MGRGSMVGYCEAEEVHGLGVGVGKRHVFVKCCRAFQVDRRVRVLCGRRWGGLGQRAEVSRLALQ